MTDYCTFSTVIQTFGRLLSS